MLQFRREREGDVTQSDSREDNPVIISDPDCEEKLYSGDWTGLEACWMSRSERGEESGRTALIIARCWRAPLLTLHTDTTDLVRPDWTLLRMLSGGNTEQSVGLICCKHQHLVPVSLTQCDTV